MTVTMTPPVGPPPVGPPPVGPVQGGPTWVTPPAGPGRPDRQSSLEWTSTFVGVAAILAGSSALSATIDGGGWVLPLFEVVVVITLIGVGGRMVRMPAALTVLLQLAAMAIALTSLFTTSGIGGVLPDQQVIADAGQLLSGAWQQILSTVPPAPSTPELSFLIALSVGATALIVDFLISEAKAPALVALPLLCLYSVPASITTEMLPWYTFAAPAILYALLLAVAGHSGRRTGLRAGVGVAVNGTVISALAIVVSLLVASTVTLVGTTGRLPRTSASSGQIGLSPFTSLRGNLQRSNPISLLTVKGLTEPDYLRTVALLTWTTGKGWSLGDLRDDDQNANGTLPGSTLTPADARVSITSLAFRDRFLPMFQHTDAISGLSTSWNYDSALGAVHRPDAANPGTYGLSVNTDKPTVAELQQDTVTPGAPLTDIGTLPGQVTALAQQVTASAPTPFDKANALQNWFIDPANGFRYSLTVPAGSSGDALVDFLRNRQGYCEQYASAMAVMLRAIGIPTRVAIGFTQGQQQPDGSYLVNSHDAHAWVEVHFDNAGWVRFDPTPLVDGQGGQQGFDAGSAPPTTSSASTTDVEPSKTIGAPDGEKPDSTTTTATSQQAAAPAIAAPPSAWPSRLIWSGLVVVVLLLVLVAPTVVRERRRRRRLAIAAAGGPAAAAAAWSEIEDLATDHAVPVQASESARVAANRLARRAHLGDRERELLRKTVVAAEHGWYSAGVPAEGGAVTTRSGAERTTTGSPSTSGAASIGTPVDHNDGPPPRPGGATTMTLPGRTPPGRAGGPGIPIAPVDLVAAVRAVSSGLSRNEPIGWFDRWLPRSLRDSGR